MVMIAKPKSHLHSAANFQIIWFQAIVRGINKMEGFRKPPLPPPRSPSSTSLLRHNANWYSESGNTLDKALAEIPDLENQSSLPSEVSRAEGPDPAHDRKLKRILASREYSRRYHLKQQRYIEKVEQDKRYLEAEVAVLPPRIKFLTQKNMLLQAENDEMKQKLAVWEGKHMQGLAETEKLLRERDTLQGVQAQQLAQTQMQQAEADFNPLPGPGFMAFDPPAPHDWQDFGPHSEPSYQTFNPPAGLVSETVDFPDFYAAQTELPGVDAQFSSEPVGLNHQLNEPFGFSEFSDELAGIVNPYLMPSNIADQVGAGDYHFIHSMNLDDDSQKAAGSSSGGQPDPLV